MYPRQIGQYLAGKWSMEMEMLLQEQLFQIITLNSIHVLPLTFEQFSDWLHSAFSFFKEWVGVGIFLACCLGGCAVCLWLVCRLQAQMRRDKVIVAQALAALECGSSPQVWLSALKSS